MKSNVQFYQADLRAMACFIKKGHRIRLTISTSDYFFLQSRKAGTAIVWHNQENQSCLLLPVVVRSRLQSFQPGSEKLKGL
jgi:predicted acyl esterase